MDNIFNPLNAELNPICHLLALLGTHHILHVSRIRVNNCIYKTSTCFDASIHHLQGVLLLYQSYMPVKMQSISTYT